MEGSVGGSVVTGAVAQAVRLSKMQNNKMEVHTIFINTILNMIVYFSIPPISPLCNVIAYILRLDLP